MSIRLLSEKDHERWDAYVTGSGASAYHQVGWKNIIEKGFGHKTYYLMSEGGRGEINGILPLVQLKSVLFGNFMISLPYFNYGGIFSEGREIGCRLLDEAIDIAKRENAEHIELRHTYRMDNGFPVKTAKVSMCLKLPANADDLWKSFTSKLRSQIRRPVREGMYPRLGKEEELDNFYASFSLNMRDLGTPVYSKEFFRSILREFPETTNICTVYTKNGRPVASGFLVGFKDKLEIPWASSLRRYNRYSPNMLLYWSSLKFACENNFTVFDFGRSTPGEGTYRFKEQWGARPIQLYWQYWLRGAKGLPELNPKNPRYKIAIIIWKKLPVGLTKLIGPLIVKNLP